MNRRGFFAALVALPQLLKTAPKKAVRAAYYWLSPSAPMFFFHKDEILALRHRPHAAQFDAISAEMEAAAKRLREKLLKAYLYPNGPPEA